MRTMKEIRTVDAVGHVLCHDITQVIKDVSMGPVFRKGHVIREEDIPVLLNVGKEHIYVWENDETMMHEDEAAEVLCSLCMGENITRGEAKEGKIDLRAACDGVLKVNEEALEAVNSFGQMMIATRHGDFIVREGEKLAGTRIIPLVIEKAKMEAVRAKAGEVSGGAPILHVLPLRKRKVGIVTTGNEVFRGRVEDTFTPVVAAKVEEFGAEVIARERCGDDKERIERTIREMLAGGADIILCAGGMSVDPDDRTPAAIREVCGQENVVTYGAPVLPGSMFLLAYYGGGSDRSDSDESDRGGSDSGAGLIPVMGLPSCVMYARRTIFDLVLPRIIAGEMLRGADFARLGQGGLCLDCEVCTFPNCGFGK